VDLPDTPWTGQLRAACEEVVERRRHLLAGVTVAEAHGAVIVCAVVETVACGASAAASQQFVDGNDRPSWDTWLGVVEDDGGQPLLLAWVPSRDVERVNAGIAVNPVDCIYWLDDWRVRRPDGLLPFRPAQASKGEPGDDWDDQPSWAPREPPSLFASPRMPQTSTLLIVGLGGVAVISNFALQSLFATGAPPWLAVVFLLAVLAIAALVSRSE
jgi:hypothetical protein